MLNTAFLVIIAYSPLLLLQEFLVVTGGLHISVLKGALIRAATGVRRSYLVMQP